LKKKFGTCSFELKKGKKFENPVVSTIDKKLSGGINMGHLTKSSPASYVQEEPEETKVKDGFLSRNKLYFIHSMAYAIGKEWIHGRRSRKIKVPTTKANAGRSFHQKIIILFITAAIFSVVTEMAAAERRTLGQRKSEADEEVKKHSIGHVPKPAVISDVETKDAPGKTYKPVKGVRGKNPNLGKSGSSAHKFIEVEIAVSDEFNIEYISSLPRAPGSDLEVLDDPEHVRVQLSASELKALADKGAKITVLRKFILAEGIKGGEAASQDNGVLTVSYCYGSNSSNIWIPEWDWTYSPICISCAPTGATVDSIDVHFEIIHPCRNDLEVDLNDEDLGCEFDLWSEEGGCVPNINKTVTGITVCNGELVNQCWLLYAADWWTYDDGYIDYWWIKVYYETCEAPANDGCPSAVAVTEGVPYIGSTVCATGGSQSSCSFGDTADVWHSFTVASTGIYTISLAGSGFDTTLAVYDYCGGTELACNDDISYPAILQSELAISLTAGTTYIIRVAGYNGATGSYRLLVEGCTPASPNDDCEDAIAISEAVPYYGSTVCATGGSQSSCSFGDTADVWHSFTPTSMGIFTISLAGSTFDTTLTVFDECGGTELACNDDTGEGLQSKITMSMSEAVTYLIRIAGYNGGSGEYTLNLTRNPCVLPAEPNNPSPANGASNVPCGTILSWNGGGAGKSEKAAAAGLQDDIKPKVIYGPDDRLDEYEVEEPNISAIGDSVPVLVCGSELTNNGNGTFTLQTQSFADWYSGSGRPLCSDEPFRNQPVVSPCCSAFLVAPDIIATAGHCTDMCYQMAVVFGYVMVDASTARVTVDASEVYYCEEVLVSEAGQPDFALIRLDREVAGHSPLSVRTVGKIPDAEPLVVVGYPVGLPRKYAGGASIRDNSNAVQFQANLDTYGGNSGSPIFSTNTLQGEGILTAGQQDFVASGSCDRSQVCSDSGCPGWEYATRTTELADWLPWETYDVYFDSNDPPVQVICNDIDVPMCEPGTLKANTRYYWQVVAENPCGETHGPSGPGNCWSFTTAPAPTITGWEIAATHGSGIGELWCPIENGYVEPRICGVTRLRVYFGQAMDINVTDPNVLSIYGVINGTQPHSCSVGWDGNTCMIITLCSALPDQDTYTISVGTEVKSSAGYALAGDRNICITALKGDVNSSRAVNSQDMLAIRVRIGESVGCSNARYEVNCSGALNSQDMLAVRTNASHVAPQCPEK
jgi:hypothetical protein